MHGIAQFLYGLVHPLAAASSLIASWFASVEGHAVSHGDFLLAALVVSACVMVIANGLWAAGERLRFAAARMRMNGELTETRTSLIFRDALLTAGWDAVALLGGDFKDPLNFGRGAELLQGGLAGPDAAPLAKSVDALIHAGQGFDMSARTKSGRRVTFRGQPVRGRSAIYARTEQPREIDEIDYRELLNAIAAPAWLRDRNLRLKWANRAFLDATGDATLEDAVASDRTLERSELDLCKSVLDNRAPTSTRRYIVVDGERRAFDLQIRELDHGGVAGVAFDVTEMARTKATLQIEADAHDDVLDRLPTAVAVFGPDRHLIVANSVFAQRFALTEQWLGTHPSMDEILELLRAAGRLPEQREFGVWKRRLLELFNDPRTDTVEIWHLPIGRSEKMSAHPHPLGGLTFIFEDITEQLAIRSSYNTLVKVQKATLDTMDEAIAVFGLDGKLKLHNRAFGQLWQLDETDLAGEPHVRILAEICSSRIGSDESWSIVIAGVNASQPEKYNAWSTVTRADGKIVTLSLTRLPDGATMATFSDVTDYLRFESMLRDGARSAA
ncbi:MAG: PAS-domain containing protein [Rhizomicrobium sp.]|jgi:PAS domain-containing protein